MNSLPLYPTILADIIGSFIIIVLSFLSLRYAYLLTCRQPDHFIWGFLYYLSLALALFAISRAAGHIVKQFLLITNNKAIWKNISPFSGGFNTLMMISVSAVTIYYHKVVEVFRLLENNAAKLKIANKQRINAANEMIRMNLHLEEIVEERTTELSQSEKKFRQFFENSKDMVYFCDSEGFISDINDSGLDMMGYDTLPEEQLNIHSFFKDEDALQEYMFSIHQNGFVRDFEIEMKKRDGCICTVLLTANAIRDEDGQIIGCEGIAKDLTNLKTMTAKLVSQEKMASVGQLAAGIAHEINTPLGIILGYSQLMQDDFPEESEEMDNLLVIERQTKACRKIVADLLKFSRQTGGSRQDLNLNEVVNEVLSVTEHTLNLDHIQVNRSLAESLPSVVGDAGKIRQVFFNIINNAHHAMEKGGTLTVITALEEKNGMVLVTFKDTGEGIPEEIQRRIFDPFFTTKSVGKGTGLGLSVSYGIIEEHGGIITIESPVQDPESHETVPGTAMHIRFPVGKESPVVNDE
jgi:PAS domain S-box-containing protein